MIRRSLFIFYITIVCISSQLLAAMAVALRDRVKGALYGAMIGDALAFPSHWYYGGEAQIRKAYGNEGIQGYVNPEERLVGSIMSKSNTGGGGRGSYEAGNIIGETIFHGKKKFWKPGTDYHYHHALKAGDNTLEILLMRRAIDIVSKHGGKFAWDEIISDYISFMTTPNTHNDTYCGTCHRMFFANYVKGKDPKDCPDNDGHNVDTIDSLVTTLPIALLSVEDSIADKEVKKMVALTRDSKSSAAFAGVFASMVRLVAIDGVDLRSVVESTNQDVFQGKVFLSVNAPDQLTACYLSSAFPVMLQLLYKYSPHPSATKEQKTQAFTEAVLANANRGGENVGSGALIGALFGAQCGFSGLPEELLEGLSKSSLSTREEIDNEIERFLDVNPILSNI